MEILKRTEVERQFSIYRDTYGVKYLGIDTQTMWRRRLNKYPENNIVKAFDECFATQKYAFKLVDVCGVLEKFKGSEAKPNDTEELPAEWSYNMMRCKRMTKLDVDYKVGTLKWPEYEEAIMEEVHGEPAMAEDEAFMAEFYVHLGRMKEKAWIKKD